MSRLKRYRAHTLEQCVEAARRDFGPDAVIHATRRQRGAWILGGRTVHELLAGPASAMVEVSLAGGSVERTPVPAGGAAAGAAAEHAKGVPSLAGAQASRAYGSPAAAGAPALRSDDPRRTRLMAQAMAVAMERDASPRALGAAASLGAAAPPAAAAHPARHPASALVPEHSLAAIQDQLASLRALVQQVLREGAPARAGHAEASLLLERDLTEPILSADFGPPFAALYASLLGQSMAARLAREVMEEARDALPPAQRSDAAAVRAAVAARVAARLPACEPLDTARIEARRGSGARPFVMALVGPTGTGKTTTLAKVASTLALRRQLRVGLVTTDTFRIGAVDQLRTYAEIVGLPLRVAEDAAGVRDACAALDECDVLLVDTAGRSQRDATRLAELRELLRAADPDETHLVLSSAASEAAMVEEAGAFSPLGVDRLVLSKLDEAVGFGVLVQALRRISTPLSFLTTGQDVPDDIEPADAGRLAGMVVGGSVR